MKFELALLPFEMNGLEPFISEKTMEFHYGKHLQTYITNLNNLILGTRFENENLKTIIKGAEGPLLNNAAQVWNHNFYFLSLKKGNEKGPSDILSDVINRSFGTFNDFKDSFTKASLGLFGSGWVWLVRNNEGLLDIIQESNAGNPLRNGLIPILTLDVWEHAYYLDYQNRRSDYINSFWNIINWEVVEKRFKNSK